MGPRSAKRAAKVEVGAGGSTINTHASQWEAPFDLAQFPVELARQLVSLAPFQLEVKTRSTMPPSSNGW